MAKKPEGVRILVQDVLRTIPEPYGEDIIDVVCLAIKNKADWLRRYNDLSEELRDWVVNNWIGKHTKTLTGLRTVREVTAKRSRLITAYTKLTT